MWPHAHHHMCEERNLVFIRFGHVDPFIGQWTYSLWPCGPRRLGESCLRRQKTHPEHQAARYPPQTPPEYTIGASDDPPQRRHLQIPRSCLCFFRDCAPSSALDFARRLDAADVPFDRLDAAEAAGDASRFALFGMARRCLALRCRSPRFDPPTELDLGRLRRKAPAGHCHPHSRDATSPTAHHPLAHPSAEGCPRAPLERRPALLERMGSTLGSPLGGLMPPPPIGLHGGPLGASSRARPAAQGLGGASLASQGVAPQTR